eukprot:Hpha_TRINITY_DN16860_c1_g5::TRINITY_DN16860_c1_g5_i1::g.153327::m.153327
MCRDNSCNHKTTVDLFQKKTKRICSGQGRPFGERGAGGSVFREERQKGTFQRFFYRLRLLRAIGPRSQYTTMYTGEIAQYRIYSTKREHDLEGEQSRAGRGGPRGRSPESV